jgi:hypothetical protein
MAGYDSEEIEESLGELEAAYANVFRGECKLVAEGSLFVCELTQPSFLSDGRLERVEAHVVKAFGSRTSATSGGEVVFDFTSPASCELYDFFGDKSLICSSDFNQVLQVRKL